MLACSQHFGYCKGTAENFETLSPLKNAILKIAVDHLEVPYLPYVYGQPERGQSPETGFDCSGFVKYVLTKAGLHIPDYIGMDGVQRSTRYSNEFWDHYGITTAMPEAGDLLFFSKDGNFPNHIGIIYDDEHYIHASSEKTEVTIDPLVYTPIEAPMDGMRQLYDRNPIGFKALSRKIAKPTARYHQELAE